MSFDDVELSRDYSYGTDGSPQFDTGVFEVASGAEERVSRRSLARHVYTVNFVDRTPTQGAALKTFHMARHGKKNSFRYWDAIDYTTGTGATPSSAGTITATDVNIGTGDGTTAAFQLVKKYTSGLSTYTRNITKPISGTVLIAVAGTTKTSGTHYNINYSTGVVTFTPGNEPSNGQAVTWGGQFNVEVRFDQDDLPISIDTYGTVSCPGGVRLIEEISNAIVYDEIPRRGASYQSIAAAASLELNPQMGETVTIGGGAGSILLLPQITAYADGGPHYTLINDTANTIAVNYAGTTLFTIQAAGDANRRDLAEVHVLYDASGNRTWKGFGP